jgi:hypothetical protein
MYSLSLLLGSRSAYESASGRSFQAMDSAFLVLALSLTTYCGFRMVSLFLGQRSGVAQPATQKAGINKAVCQFCNQPLPVRRRLVGALHCGAECKEAERFKLARAVEGVSGGPLFL